MLDCYQTQHTVRRQRQNLSVVRQCLIGDGNRPSGMPALPCMSRALDRSENWRLMPSPSGAAAHTTFCTLDRSKSSTWGSLARNRTKGGTRCRTLTCSTQVHEQVYVAALQTCTRTYTCIHTEALALSLSLSYTHTQTHTYIHTHIHTCTHTYTHTR